jgi:hypothetical protein
MHRLETVGKSAFGRKTLTIQGMGQSMGWDFFQKHRNEKALSNQGFNV